MNAGKELKLGVKNGMGRGCEMRTLVAEHTGVMGHKCSQRGPMQVPWVAEIGF